VERSSDAAEASVHTDAGAGRHREALYRRRLLWPRDVAACTAFTQRAIASIVVRRRRRWLAGREQSQAGVERTPKEDDAPIVAAGYEICRATDGAGCVKGERAGRGIEAFDDLKVPDGRVCGGVATSTRRLDHENSPARAVV
jgi:hypothetical protein